MPIPLIYTTDLYHPHDDPDDHFDLATLFAMRDFDIRAIVIDRGERGADRPGIAAVEQLAAMTRRQAPCALGMIQNVPWHGFIPDDELEGVNLIIDALRRSEAPVTVFTTGSLRDVAAAYLREPELFQRRVERLYINAGHSSGKEEWNVKLEPWAYFRMLRAGLPIYWMPCFGDDGFQTYWNFRQGDVLECAPLAVQNYIVYALSKTSPREIDPIQALQRPISEDAKKKFWSMKRNMWCTAGFFNAAGQKNGAFSFVKKRVVLDESAQTTTLSSKGEGVDLMTFHQNDAEAYTQSMTAALRDLLAGMAS